MRDEKKFVLDTNCIIDLEEGRPRAVFLRSVVKVWRAGQIDLAVVAISASENLQREKSARDFSTFEAKLRAAGLSGVTILLPPEIWDVTFWGYGLWSDSSMEDLANRIREILFPKSKELPPHDAQQNSKWRNQLCDSLVAWACIYHDWPCLVTRDKNFHCHANSLRDLGLAQILYPEAAVEFCKD